MIRSRRAMKNLGVVLVLLALILAAGLAVPIARPANADDPNVSVNKTAQAVDGCRRYDVTLNITGISPPTPVDVMLVFDRSGSMNDGSYCDGAEASSKWRCEWRGGTWIEQPLTDAKDAANSFIDQLDVDDKVGLVSYSTTATKNNGLTFHRNNVKNSIDGLYADGYTNIAEGIFQATQELNTNGRPNAVKALIVLSDGVANMAHVSCSSCGTYPCTDTCCTNDAIVQAQAAKDQGYTVFSIFLSNIGDADSGCETGEVEKLGHDTMEAISSGSIFFYSTPDSNDLEEIYAYLASQLVPAATKVEVVDIVSDEFEVDKQTITPSKGYASLVDNTITWTFDLLGTETVTLTYQVTAKAGYSSPPEIEVNDSATMNYTDADGVPQSMPFPNPTVVVPTDLEASASSNSPVNFGDPVNFDGSASSGGTPPYQYDWDFTYNGSWDASGEIVGHTYPDCGSYTARLRVTDADDCEDEVTIPIEVLCYNPGIEIQKTVYAGHDSGASCGTGGELVVGENGDNITYCFTITNTGDTHLNSITITDPLLGIPPATVTLKSGSEPLAPLASMSFFYETTINGDKTNTATAEGNPCKSDGTDLPGLDNPSDDDIAAVAECIIGAEASNNGPVCEGQPVQLSGEALTGTPDFDYSWTGPLGFSSTHQNPIRSPAVAGTYTLVVTDADKCTGSDTTIVVVNPLPDCTITAPSLVSPGSTNTASVTPAGDTYFWSVTGEGTLAGGQGTPSITWTALDEGTVTISVTVTDANGCKSTCVRKVTVEAPPPLCEPNILLAVLLDGSSTMNSTEWLIQLDGLSEAILDTECMPDCYVELTVIQFAGEIWGDARTEVPPTVINSDNREDVAQDVLDIVNSRGITPMEAGIDRAVDELRGSIYFRSALKRIINISSDVQENTLDRPAVEEARDNAIAAGITEISAEGVGDFRIPEDQDWMVLNILHPQPGHIAPYSWDPGWVYAVGTDADKFKEAICHKIGLTNYTPVAIDDAYSVDEDVTITVAAMGVLANDTDADGDTLAAILVSDVGHGTLILNTDGSFSYTPSAGFTGPDSFTYKANDGTDDSNVATVTITVNPIGPGPEPGRVAYIVIEPDGAEITAGATQPYTASAFDALDNYIGDVTNDTRFSIIEGGHGGSWVDNVYTSQYAGTWTVTGNIMVPGTYDGISDWATLTVIAGSLDHIVISADTDTITAGDTLAFSAEAFDAQGNSLGNVTSETEFSAETGAGGNWDPPNVYTSENAGTWTVTGTYDGMSDTYSLTVNARGGGRGGGGGGGGRPEYLTVKWEGEITQERITRSGKLLATLEAPSPDEMHLLVIDKGTITLDSEGDVVKLIEITEATAPSLPASTALVGSAYDFGGNLSITFSKPVTLTLSYNVSDLRDDTLALSMRRYSSEDGLWQVVETESSQIADIGSFTGKPEGFSVFAIFADLPSFEVSNLSISPSHREIWDFPTFAVRNGEEAVITADVTNTGNYEASYIASLQVNGEIMDSQELTLAPGQTEQVTFTISGIEQGDYQIVVGGLSDEFTSSLWINWLPIGAILGALLLIVLLLVGWRYRKREKPAE